MRIFFPRNYHITPMREIDFIVNLKPGAKTISKTPYRMTPQELWELQMWLKELLALGFIRYSISPWGVPMIFIKKKDGSLILCIYYRDLNQAITNNKYPIPRTEDFFYHMKGATVFSKNNIWFKCHQLRTKEVDIPKKIKIILDSFWKFEFTVVSFVLTNELLVLMILMNSVFQKYLDQFAQVFLDDILMYSKN